MYRIKLAAGTVLEFDSLEALTAHIRTGEVDAEALIFHQRANQWLPIHVHPAWKQALAAIERSGHALPASARVGGAAEAGPAGQSAAPAAAAPSSSASASSGTAHRPSRPVLRVPRPAPAPAAAGAPSAAGTSAALKPAAAPTSRPTAKAAESTPAATLAETLGLDLLEIVDATEPPTSAPAAAPAAAPSTSSAPAPTASAERATSTEPTPTPPSQKRVEPDVSVDNLDEELELLAPDEVPAADSAPAAPVTQARPAAKTAKPTAARPPAKQRPARPAGPAPSLLEAAPTAPRSQMLEPQAVAPDTPAPAAPAATAATTDADVREQPIERSRVGEPSIVDTPSAPTRADAPREAMSAERNVAADAMDAAAEAASHSASTDAVAPADAHAVMHDAVLAPPADALPSVETAPAVMAEAPTSEPAPAPVVTMPAALGAAEDVAPAVVKSNRDEGATRPTATEPVAPWIDAATTAAIGTDIDAPGMITAVAEPSEPLPMSAPRPVSRRLPSTALAAGIGVAVVGLAVAAFAMRDRGEAAPSAPAPEPPRTADAGVPTAPLVLPPESDSASPAGSEPALRIAPDDVPPSAKAATAAPATPTRTEAAAAPTSTAAARTTAPERTDVPARDAAARRAADAPAETPAAIVAAPVIGPIDVAANTVTLRTDIAPSVLANRYGAAHDAAWNELVAKLRLAGFAQLFAPAKLAPGSAASTKVALAAARQHIGAWRSRAAVIEKAYRDSSAALQGNWTAAERAAWDARPKRAESGEDAQTASALLGAADRMYAVLAANAGGYQLVGGDLRFTDTGAQREYWEARRAFLAALGGAGEGSTRLPVGAIVTAVGATRPPDGTIAN